ncbi:Pisatin demethylase [Diplodia seriata]|uniref:Pisatin demethylase n=1 Tax=Diplodia seriata TaxID=420778 RepID=A0A1S8BAC0_9PEZI|nr:Pisatin demethylase [Diplodia seriata]
MAKVYNYTYGLDVWLTTRKSLQLRAEIDERTAAGDLSASSPIPYQVARCMPYLQAVIKEGLRLEGSPGIPLPRVVPQCGAEIAGHFFPGGTVVGVNAYVLHRNKDIFGHDAEDFNPDRWLGDKEVVSRSLPLLNNEQFGGGSRVCIGKHIAFIELSTLIPDLVRKFDFELVDPCAQRKRRNVFFIKHQNLDVKISERRAC